MEPVERRLSILMAAKRVFATKGYYSAGVADIIAEADIARGTFYLYFTSKREVFSALLEYIVESIASRMVEISIQEPEEIYNGLITNLDRLRVFFIEDPDLATILLREGTAVDNESRERFQELVNKLADWGAKLLEHWVKVGILRDIDPKITAYAAIGAARELLEQYFNSGHLQQEGDKVIETMMRIYLFGIINPAHNKLVVDHIDALVGPTNMVKP